MLQYKSLREVMTLSLSDNIINNTLQDGTIKTLRFNRKITICTMQYIDVINYNGSLTNLTSAAHTSTFNKYQHPIHTQ